MKMCKRILCILYRIVLMYSKPSNNKISLSQNAKRKGVSEVVDKCQGVLKEAMGHFQDDKIAPKVKRCLDIWREREVFEDKFIAELEATLDPGNPKSKEDEQEIVDSFQVRIPYNRERF